MRYEVKRTRFRTGRALLGGWAGAVAVLAMLAGCAAGGGAGLPSVAPPGPPAGLPSAGGDPAAQPPAAPRDPGAGAGEAAASSEETEAAAEDEKAAAEDERSEGAEADSGAAVAREEIGSSPAGAAQTSGERQTELDGELRASLSEFDRMLLREQEKLAERAAEAPPPGSPAAGGMGGDGGGMGDDSGSAAGGGGGDANTSGESTDFATGEEPAHRAETAASGDEESGRGGRVPPDVGRGDDDDIVARQLREAAMAEEDPELRARLWDEYRAYKGLPTRGGAGEGDKDEDGDEDGDGDGDEETADG